MLNIYTYVISYLSILVEAPEYFINNIFITFALCQLILFTYTLTFSVIIIQYNARQTIYNDNLQKINLFDQNVNFLNTYFIICFFRENLQNIKINQLFFLYIFIEPIMIILLENSNTPMHRQQPSILFNQTHLRPSGQPQTPLNATHSTFRCGNKR